MNITIEICIFELFEGPKFSLNWQSSFLDQISPDKVDFLEQICPEKVFPFKNGKSQQHHWILHIQIRLAIKFRLKMTILTFCTKFAQKGYFRSKTEKVNTAIKFCITEFFWVPNFSLNWQSSFFGPNFPKRSISSLNRKSEYHH